MGRRYVPYEVREEFFALVCGGFALQAAADRVGVSHRTATYWWRSSGLVSPVIQFGAIGGLPGSAPVGVPGIRNPEEGPRRRRALSSEDRAVIAAGLRAGWALTRIATLIGRDKSVVSREVARNRGPDGSYWAPIAHRVAHERRRRPKAFKLIENPGLCRRIETWMDDGWSPGLIASMLRHAHPGHDPAARMARVSHETIYRALYVQTRGSLRKDLAAQLLTKRRARKPHADPDGRRKGLYREAFTISQRPAEVADRAVPGHWEGDLILGAGNRSAVGTLVERSTRFVLLLHLPGRHDAESVAQAMIREMGQLPVHLRRSLTWDRGSELANYRDVEAALEMPVFFCDPHSPWQRGSNENTNRLLRFWLEKGSDLSTHSADDLARIAATLNKRPRPTLDLRTPAQALAELLANPAAA
ncbi:IS30 family transposase [Nocardioides sp. dk4132]|uniref:IS30 family transposase n=2 Tax=unclassified Nocardioides TaxID=2615069 RepID=UPI0012962A90|nr:IS30 family transposase [Nocardioides sp. dk4132]QGA06052.1 IS30 family transposase [Nocardioides sp. dk884]QGA06178.1 IS30 family transposase [Nocardioides sp. dk884]QGA08182.1 IS30 family transposase [Nocardioides sp. dk884]QGA09169.1 IS30 family transposase [Nocardioides sp. dk884]